MFRRVTIKHAAKARLSEARWMAVLVSLVASIIIGLGNVSLDISVPSYPYETNDVAVPYGVYFTVLVVALGISLAVSLFVLIIRLFASNIVRVGLANWFVQFSNGESPSFSVLFSGFKNYRTNLVVMGLRDLYIFLWSLLFVIPGVIKRYAYYFVPYILNDNPDLTTDEACRISQEMTDGCKWDIFVFDLSFIGWRLLSLITCGVLDILFVVPYYNAAQARLYIEIRTDALYKHRIYARQLNMPESDY